MSGVITGNIQAGSEGKISCEDSGCVADKNCQVAGRNCQIAGSHHQAIGKRDQFSGFKIELQKASEHRLLRLVSEREFRKPRPTIHFISLFSLGTNQSKDSIISPATEIEFETGSSNKLAILMTSLK